MVVGAMIGMRLLAGFKLIHPPCALRQRGRGNPKEHLRAPPSLRHKPSDCPCTHDVKILKVDNDLVAPDRPAQTDVVAPGPVGLAAHLLGNKPEYRFSKLS